MGEPMTLKDEDVGRIGEYVKPWLRELVDEMVPRQELGGAGTQLLERMVRVGFVVVTSLTTLFALLS